MTAAVSRLTNSNAYPTTTNRCPVERNHCNACFAPSSTPVWGGVAMGLIQLCFSLLHFVCPVGRFGGGSASFPDQSSRGRCLASKSRKTTSSARKSRLQPQQNQQQSQPGFVTNANPKTRAARLAINALTEIFQVSGSP